MNTQRVMLHFPEPPDLGAEQFRRLVDVPASSGSGVAFRLHAAIVTNWGDMAVTDWLLKNAEACYSAEWPNKVAQVATEWNQEWKASLDRADVFGALLDAMVCAKDDSLQSQFRDAIRRVRDENANKQIAHLHWPTDVGPVDYVAAANAYRSLLREAPAYRIYGALAENRPATHGNGVISIRVHLGRSLNDGWKLHVLPWSRYVPTPEARETQCERLAAALNQSVFSDDPPREVFLNIQPVETSCHEAISHSRTFEGESLGLAILLAVRACIHRRTIDAWATGKITVDGRTFESVMQVAGKAQSLAQFLRNNSELSEAERNRFQILVASGDRENAADVRRGFADANLDPKHWQPIVVDSVMQLLELARLVDPFGPVAVPSYSGLLSQWKVPAKVPSPTKDQLVDEEFWDMLAPAKETPCPETIGSKIAAKWLGADSDNRNDYQMAREILLCTPFHADQNDAAVLLRSSAAKLAAYLSWRRSVQQDKVAATLFPVPMIVDLASCQDNTNLADYLFGAGQGFGNGIPLAKDLFEGLRLEHVQQALSQEYRFGLIIIDSEVNDCRRFDKSERSHQRFRQFMRQLLGKDRLSGLARQCFVLIAPDIHIQLFWQECLQGPDMGVTFEGP